MLPSGNDAAHCLAEYFGGLLKNEAQDLEDKLRVEQETKLKEDHERKKDDIENKGSGQESIVSNFPSSSTNHTQNDNSRGSEGLDNYKDKAGDKNKSDDDPSKKNYFTGTQIKKSPFVVKHSQFRNYTEVMFFLEEMNKTADRLGLKNSVYDSPHGLSNKQNLSSALDVSKLSTICMQNKKFREVVSQKFYSVKKNTNGNRRTYKWYNTHLMLGQRGINGIKTGITPNAGPCLCTSISNDDFELIIVILNTKNMDIRWPETWKLANWAMTRMKTIAKFQQAQDTNDAI